MEIIRFIFQTLLGELILVIVGVLFANYIKSYWEERRYGGWRVHVRHGEKVHVNRAVSSRKAKEVLEESADLAVFLKGIVSPYAFLNCDPVEDGLKNGLLVINRQQRCFLIDLEKNPPKQQSEPSRPPL